MSQSAIMQQVMGTPQHLHLQQQAGATAATTQAAEEAKAAAAGKE
eukprot:CAMPEP_0173394848 /NCGR_PEP_ID=MMETSP1356-20130122/29600_1 /TAXON_ID=77927 ORGANISM="Hemiselmis virescens, Strain PCC157" /NCGR_SAMPLE_ID=MMETSP1356 /ASSEMBLY_ACC=CAM_ASM_000847 /LENGTH=44 /DNA_ID= /DNA_START= /DNA_END= /DNA_ORIENTATION=